MYENIPAELKALPQWVIVGADRGPVDPKTGRPAKTNDWTTWSTYEHACSVATRGIGFVFTPWDPYCLIDIDDKPHNPPNDEQRARQLKVFEVFQSYAERSQSGRGCHIIIKGTIPTGIDKDHIGVYSEGRYGIMTGDVVRNAPITDYHDLINLLHREATSTSQRVELVDHTSHLSDVDLIDMASNAINGDKFDSLCAGDMTDYPSQSEADFALLSIIAFYTQDNEQVRRIFRMTALGKREKAQRDRYLNDALSKIRAKQAPQVDLSQLAANAQQFIQTQMAEQTSHVIPMQMYEGQPEPEPTAEPMPVEYLDEPIPNATFAPPPGIVGEIASYIYQTSIRPVPEISLAASIALVAGIVGRSYNISGTGLNQYIVLLAKTGTGKEGALSGMNRLLTAVQAQVPMAFQFMGPAGFASGPALIRMLSEKPCCVSVLGEFGLLLQRVTSMRASATDTSLRAALLDLYGKSGFTEVLGSTAYSDSEKNTKTVRAPNLSILGESTPETFFEALDGSKIAEGFLPRFAIIEYKGERPERNKRNAGMAPPAELVRKLVDLIVIAQSTAQNNAVCPVQVTPEGEALLDAFDQRADARIRNAGASEGTVELWNRAHLKSLKMAGLIAVGVNPHSPVIDEQAAQWAIDFVLRDVTTISERFKTGDVGQGESKQYNDLKRVLATLLTSKAKDERLEAMRKDGIVPYRDIIRRLHNCASFRGDRLGATNALTRVLTSMKDGGELAEIAQPVLTAKYKFSGKAYALLS